MYLFDLLIIACAVALALCVTIPAAMLIHASETAKERRKQAQAAAKEAEDKRKADEAEAARQAREEERQRKRAARLEAARQLAEYKERALCAEKELRAMRCQDAQEAAPSAAKRTQEPPVAQLRKPAAQPRQAADNAPEEFAVACMLAKKYADNAQEIAGKAFTITEKLDGVRCIARMEAGRVELYARSGKRIEGLTDIENALAALRVEGVLDGELLIQGRGVLPSKEEYKQTCAIVRTNGRKTGLVYHVFDVLPLADYRLRRSTIPYRTRRVALERIKAAAPFVQVVPVLYSGTDTAQIEKQLQQQREARHEGIMINLNDAPYSFNRSACLLKYKIMNDCDLQIVALNPGTGCHADMLGSLSVAYKGNTVRVGSGIPNALRRAIWANPAAYIGRVVTVQYFEETQDKRGNKSLRFPVFKELREIGKAVSYA